jgi:putative phosphoesterase
LSKVPPSPPPTSRALRIGLISDTHGLLRPEALAYLRGSDHIVHAGDICDARVLEELAAIAPVTAVRGNNDWGTWTERLRDEERITLGGIVIHVIHDVGQLRIAPRAEGIDVVVYGHSHKPQVDHRDGVLFVNPGSAGPRRFTLPIAAGELVVERGVATARTVELVGAKAAFGERLV